jgi:Flp pilus assembly protein TadB
VTLLLVFVLVVLVGDRLRVRPRGRPVTVATGHSGELEPVDRRTVQQPTRRRRPTAQPEHVAAWCDGLARALSGGSTLATAIREVEPPPACSTEIESIRLALTRGASLSKSCEIATSSVHLSVALTVIRACAAHGGPAAETLSRTAATLRGRAADIAERQTQSAQARMSAVVMTILPICMLALLLVTSGSVRGFVMSSAGAGVVAAGAVLNALGWRWMARLIDGSRR